MKAQLRIATKEPYCYIEATVEGTADEIIDQYQELHTTYDKRTGGEGLEPSSWNPILDGILKGAGKLSAEDWEKMDEKQKWMLNELKKSRNRK